MVRGDRIPVRAQFGRVSSLLVESRIWFVHPSAEAVGRLHHRDQNGCPDRTDPRNLVQQFPGLVLLGFHQQIPPHLRAQEPQDIELLVVVFHAPPHASFLDLAEPFRTVTIN